MYNRSIFLIFIILIHLKGCCGTWCYICHYPDESRCGDEFLMTNQDAFECPGTCFKKRGYEEDSSLVKTLRIIRGCDSITAETCRENDQSLAFTGIKCLCNDDFCNGSIASKCFAAVTILVTLLACLHNLFRTFI